MSSPGSVTQAILDVVNGGSITARNAAAQRLWQSYFARLVRRMQTRLPAVMRVATSEEDVAISVFESFFRAAEEGRFPKLGSRRDLWQVLVVIAGRKAADLLEYGHAQCRDVNRLAPKGDDEFLASLVAKEPDPAADVQVADQCLWLLDRLGDERDENYLRRIALARLDGQSTEEIARACGLTRSAVRRKIDLIRDLWKLHAPQPRPESQPDTPD